MISMARIRLSSLRVRLLLLVLLAVLPAIGLVLYTAWDPRQQARGEAQRAALWLVESSTCPDFKVKYTVSRLSDAEAALDPFTKHPKVHEVLARGANKAAAIAPWTKMARIIP